MLEDIVKRGQEYSKQWLFSDILVILRHNFKQVNKSKQLSN